MRTFARRWLILTIYCGAAFVAAGGRPAAAFVTVYGGPEYASSTDTGYTWVLELGHFHTPVNDSGQAIGWAQQHPAGSPSQNRAVAWSPSGSAVLGNLGTSPFGSTEVIARDINASGAVVGLATKYDAGTSLGKRAVRWDSFGASPTELGILGTNPAGVSESSAYAVADSGTIVGVAAKYDAGVSKGLRAVRWSGSGAVATELDVLGTNAVGDTESFAADVNESGATVGWASRYVGGVNRGYLAVKWDGVSTAAQELGHLGGDPFGATAAQAFAVNESGVPVGMATKFVGGIDKGLRAVRWDAMTGAVVELDNLGLDSSGETNTRALAINDNGTIAGFGHKHVALDYKGDRAMRWDLSGTAVTELANLGVGPNDFTHTYARDINEAGVIAGMARRYDNGSLVGNRAVVWMPDGGIVDLNTLLAPGSGWTLREAYNISDAGWVAGVGTYNPPGPEVPYGRHFVLQLPVPEPGTPTMFVVGIVVLRFRGRRRG
jgi:uncharacterized membrane protein